MPPARFHFRLRKGRAVALQKFRDKQKMIYWIVAIVVIPSFCLFGFTDIVAYNPAKAPVGKAFGKEYNQQEFDNFFIRLRAIHLGQPVFFTFNDYSPAFGQTQQEAERIGAFFCMALRDEALRSGIVVTDDEVGTFIRLQMNYTGNNAAELQKKVESMVGSVIRLSSVWEYKLAVREWLTLRKYLQVLDDTAVVPLPLADLTFAQEKTQLSFRKLVIPAMKYLEAADKELGALKPAELQERAQKFLSANQSKQNRDRYPFLWIEPKWSFEYIMAPLVVPALEPKITDEVLKAHYEKRKSTVYRAADGKEKPFEEVKQDVETDYRNTYRREEAQKTLFRDFGNFITKLAKESAAASDTETSTFSSAALKVEQIAADQTLAARGLKAGVSGDKPATASEIAKLAPFVDSGMALALQDLDRKLRAKEDKKEDYDRLLSEYKQLFRGSSFQEREYPIAGGDNLFRIRITEYIPGEARKLTAADGKVDEDLLKDIRKVLAQELAMNMAQEKAVAAMSQLDKPDFEGIAITDEKKSYLALSRDSAEGELCNAIVGQPLTPKPSPREGGYVVVKLTGRESAQPTAPEQAQQITTLNYEWRGRSEYASLQAFDPKIKIGRRLGALLLTSYQKGELSLPQFGGE